MISKRLVRYNRRFIMIQGEITKERMEGWKFDSSCEEGFHEIIAPGKADCEQEYIYRLNLSAGKSFDLETGKLELAETNPLVYVHGGYYELGEKIGKFGWSVEKKKN